MDEKSLIRYLRTRARKMPKRGWRCPDESEIAAYADGRVGETERTKLEAHLAGCEFCLSQVAFLAEIEKTELPNSVPASLLARVRGLAGTKAKVALIPAWGRFGAAAAVACLAVVITVSVRYSHRTAPPAGLNPANPAAGTPSVSVETRGGDGAALAIVSPAPESAVVRKDLEFRWNPAQGALGYEVRLMTTDGDLAWEGKTEANSLKLPADVKLEAGRRYYLLIQAEFEGGKVLGSHALAFSVKK